MDTKYISISFPLVPLNVRVFSYLMAVNVLKHDAITKHVLTKYLILYIMLRFKTSAKEVIWS